LGTIAGRILAYLDAEGRSVDANEVSQAIGVNIDVVRTTLSKLFNRGAIARPKVGLYRSLLAEHEHRSRATCALDEKDRE
jgi:predicted transcriptional regulator of viral defense system